MHTQKSRALALVVILVSLSLFWTQRAMAEERCLLFTFSGTPGEIRFTANFLRVEMLKYKTCTEIIYDYGDDEHKKELEKKYERYLGPVEKEFGPPNRISFSCLQQDVNHNAFEIAGRAYLSLPSRFVSNSIQLTVTTGCCTSASCISLQCAGDDVAHCWDKGRKCRLHCSTCSE